MGVGKSKQMKEKGKRCPFKLAIPTGQTLDRLCIKQYCAIWTGREDNGECALLLLALNSSTIIKQISPMKKS